MADIYSQSKGVKIEPDVIINLEMYIIPPLNLGYDRNPAIRGKDSINRGGWGTLISRGSSIVSQTSHKFMSLNTGQFQSPCDQKKPQKQKRKTKNKFPEVTITLSTEILKINFNTKKPWE